MPSNYDVVVAGGGTGGFGAAIGAARSGARVLLIEKYGFLGGAATNSNVLAFCGLFQHGGETAVPAVAGASDMLMAELERLGQDTKPRQNSKTGNWIVLLEPERLKLAMDRCLAEAGVETLLHARTSDVAAMDGSLGTLTVEAHEGPLQLSAGAFVDATGDAHLARRAHLPSADASDSRELQPYTAPIRVGGLPPGFQFDRSALAKAVVEYNKSGAYPIHRPNGGFFAPIQGSDDIWWMVIDLPCKSATSAELSEAERYTRAAANDYIAMLRDVQPDAAKAELVQTGPQVGIREGRHCLAEEEIVADDLSSGRQRSDGIARAAWPMEDYVRLGKADYTHVGGAGFAHVPMGAIRARGVKNLFLAGRTIGADRQAYASVRVMGTAFATGFAAGVSAANHQDGDRAIVEKITSMGGLI
ncbi:MAG: FAD-dependent oxidoreductase [Celeribacter sp.]|jgi:hypothetical protein